MHEEFLNDAVMNKSRSNSRFDAAGAVRNSSIYFWVEECFSLIIFFKYNIIAQTWIIMGYILIPGIEFKFRKFVNYCVELKYNKIQFEQRREKEEN